jgi:hypothetical protein
LAPGGAADLITVPVESALEHQPFTYRARRLASLVTSIAGRLPPGPTLGALRHRCVDEGAVASTRTGRGWLSGSMGLWLRSSPVVAEVMGEHVTPSGVRRSCSQRTRWRAPATCMRLAATVALLVINGEDAPMGMSRQSVAGERPWPSLFLDSRDPL